jgi:hypothetical protein
MIRRTVLQACAILAMGARAAAEPARTSVVEVVGQVQDVTMLQLYRGEAPLDVGADSRWVVIVDVGRVISDPDGLWPGLAASGKKVRSEAVLRLAIHSPVNTFARASETLVGSRFVFVLTRVRAGARSRWSLRVRPAD